MNEAAEAAGLDARRTIGGRPRQGRQLAGARLDPAAEMKRCGDWRSGRPAIRRPLRLGRDNGADGFFLDIEGAAHLFGGEEKLLADLSDRL